MRLEMSIRASLLLFSVSALMLLLPLPSVSEATAALHSAEWSFCAAKNYPVTIKDVLINPDPVVAGSEATFTIPAYTSEELQGGSVVVTVLFHGIKVHTEKDDICSKSACPIQGDFTFDNTEFLPVFTPPGAYTLKFQVLSSASQELSCVSVKFNIVWGSEWKELVDNTVSVFHRKIGQRV